MFIIHHTRIKLGPNCSNCYVNWKIERKWEIRKKSHQICRYSNVNESMCRCSFVMLWLHWWSMCSVDWAFIDMWWIVIFSLHSVAHEWPLNFADSKHSNEYIAYERQEECKNKLKYQRLNRMTHKRCKLQLFNFWWFWP